MKIKIFDSKEKLIEDLALWIGDLIKATLKNQEVFTMALSGGETPQGLFKKLGSKEYREKIDWQRVHIFWGDERAVPFDDNRNNAKMAYENLLNHVDIPAAQIHKMRVDIEPVFSAKGYEEILHSYFDNTPFSFDLVLLGIGDDGHTLSIFPHSHVIEDTKNWVTAVYNEKQQMYRITLMPAIVNKASCIAFMVTGKNKAEILHRIIEGIYEPEVLPAQLIKPEKGELHWFLDEEAGAKIDKIK